MPEPITEAEALRLMDCGRYGEVAEALADAQREADTAKRSLMETTVELGAMRARAQRLEDDRDTLRDLCEQAIDELKRGATLHDRQQMAGILAEALEAVEGSDG